jgi:hypothetical protein
VVSIVLQGEVLLRERGLWSVNDFRDMHDPSEQERGFEGRLFGYGRYDLDQGKFVAFELVAVGVRWGGTQYNSRSDDSGPAPIGFLFRLAGDSPRERVAPTNFKVYGW